MIVATGCAAGFPSAGTPRPLATAEACFRDGDWACVHAAVEGNRNQAQGPQTNVALYFQALVWVHPANPGQSLARAREAFAQIVESEPDSPMGLASLAWLAVIDDLQQQESEGLRFRQENTRLTEALSEIRTRTMLIQERLEQMKAIDLSVE